MNESRGARHAARSDGAVEGALHAHLAEHVAAAGRGAAAAALPAVRAVVPDRPVLAALDERRGPERSLV